MQKIIYYTFLILLTTLQFSSAQPEKKNILNFLAALSKYRNLMDKKDYKNAEQVISLQLKKIYSKRITYSRIPNDFITLSAAEDAIDLNKLFQERRAEGFFIEENNQLFVMHFDLGRCYYEMHQDDKALNNYYQALRFHSIIPGKDDAIFYQIAWTFKKMKKKRAYLHNLETAYELNPEKIEYSLELGRELYLSKQPKKSIFHLNRYIKSVGDAIKKENLDIYIKIANLNEKIGNYLETAKYYQAYLKKNPKDSYINFALGYIAYKHVGNYQLALKSFQNVLKIMPKNEIWRISKSYEFIGDMLYSNLKFKEAISAYLQTIKYQDMILNEIEILEKKTEALAEKIYNLKRLLLKNKTDNNFNEYQLQVQEQASLKYQITRKYYEFNKLNRGKVFWNTAEIFEKLENYQESINYYQKAISINYKPNKAQKKIKYCKGILERGFKVPIKY